MTHPHSGLQSEADSATSSALKLLQDRGVQVLNAIDDGVYFLDPSGRAIFINEAAGRLLGYTNREVLGQSMHALTHHHYADGSPFPEDACPIMSTVTDAVQQRVGSDTFWTKSRQPLPVDYTSIPIKEGRTVVGVVVTFRDISDQQRVEQQAERLKKERLAREQVEQAQEALRASTERYHFLAEAIPVQIWTARPDGTLDYVTQRVADYFGETAEQILGTGWQNVVHPDDLPGAAARWMHSLSSGEPYEVEFRLRRADGQYRWYLSRALPQRGPHGAVVQWFGTNTDIDDQKRAPR